MTTDEAGLYNAPALIPGTYTVRVEFPGFKTLDRANVVVEVGQEIRIDLTIEPGQQSETVTVNEAIPLVDTAGSKNREFLNQRPRRIQDLFLLKFRGFAEPRSGAPSYETQFDQRL